MATQLKKVMDRLPKERQQRIKARTKALIAEELTLRDLRKARDLTQVELAALLDVGQEGISRLESRSDLLLSTIRKYVEATGGQLDLVVRYPDRPDVTLRGFGDDK